MRYSVIVPVWNRKDLILRALNSIKDQDCIDKSKIEIIVIDDGSTDGTEEKLKTFNPNPCKIKIIRTHHIGEPGSVRNLGLKESIGEIIAYLDSDDFWLPHHLASIDSYFKRNPDIAMVSANWGMASFSILGEDNVKTELVKYPHKMWTVNTNCRAHKKSCIEKVGYFNEQKWGEDQDFFGRIEKHFKTIKIPYTSSINGYIKGGNNITYQFDNGIKARFS